MEDDIVESWNDELKRGDEEWANKIKVYEEHASTVAINAIRRRDREDARRQRAENRINKTTAYWNRMQGVDMTQPEQRTDNSKGVRNRKKKKRSTDDRMDVDH